MIAVEGKREFVDFFRSATGHERPYEWQIKAACCGLPDLLAIPTGLGKTEGAILAWAWRRLHLGLKEPLHLVYCLPMRCLVSQTVERVRLWFENLAVRDQALPSVLVNKVMGGAVDEEWAQNPDRPWVLIGTQDQLLSRALNRGYSMNRFDWPVHSGLLNQDCHWIVDETQLMGPGLWTTSQLDWMRRKRFSELKPCRTTWMSATVGTAFLETTDRKADGLDTFKPFDPLLGEDPSCELRRRRSAGREVNWITPLTGKGAPGFHEQVAQRAREEHSAGTLTLIISNTVKMAQHVFRSIPEDGPPKILLTSRFRACDRRTAEQTLSAFEARRSKSPNGKIDGDPGLICVSTQVVEAGLDVSAHRLWSELAPWASVIQRLGRLNRDGRDEELCGKLGDDGMR
jgi:CRISPR-associated endonuclease/helicase Cas3